jgi:CRP-like cAMP-binding protein
VRPDLNDLNEIQAAQRKIQAENLISLQGEPAIGRHLTLDEMAARIGTTREMVCRALYRFADKRLIDVTRTEFVLTDEAGLGKLAEGS